MILAIDVGNSNIVLGCIKGKEILLVARMATDPVHTDDQYAVEISSVLRMHQIDEASLTDCIISSVVPPLTNTLRRAVRHILDREPMVVGPGLRTGLNIKIDNPAQLGSDLVVDAVAALASYPVPLVVIDMGTATTLSVIDRRHCYLGGAILPGVGLSLQALTHRTAQLPGIGIEAPERVIGRNTIDCMKSGIVFGNAAMLDGLIDRIETELGEPVTVVATGGVASTIVPHCKRNIVCDETLLLKGLQLIYEKNRKENSNG